MVYRLVYPALLAGAHAEAAHEESAASFPRIREIRSDEERSSIHERWKNRDPADSCKDWPVQEAMTPLTSYGDSSLYVRAPRSRGEDGRWRDRAPAPAAGLTDHVWTWRERSTRPAILPPQDTTGSGAGPFGPTRCGCGPGSLT